MKSYSHQTNSVDVEFTTDFGVRYNGFTLDVRSTPCTDVVEVHQIKEDVCDDTVQEVMVPAGEMLKDALVTHRVSNDVGDYPNSAC